MAVLTPSRASAADFRAVLLLLVAESRRDLEGLWAGWPWDDAEALASVAASEALGVVWAGQDAAGGVAADFYDEWRDAAQARGRFRVSPVGVAPEEQVSAGVRNAVGSLFGADPDVAAAKERIAGSVGRLVQSAGTATITDAAAADPAAAGWSRVTAAGACDFCRMLAGRGGVYRSERSSRFAAHDWCSCACVPSWDPDAEEVPVVAYVASSRKQTPESRARVKAWMEANL